jgi:putative membrane protein
MAYLGTQGDIWDAHKDMALASLGALIAMCITMLINMNIQKGFIKEWKLSLSIKSNRPLGEDEINRLIKTKED